MKKLDLTEFLSIPFSEADCYELGSLLYQAAKGFRLPGFDYVLDCVSSHHEAIDGAIKTEAFVEIQKQELEYLDAILFNSNGGKRHIGFYVGDGKFIHQNLNGYPTVVKLNTPMYRNSIIGFYRYAK